MAKESVKLSNTVEPLANSISQVYKDCFYEVLEKAKTKRLVKKGETYFYTHIGRLLSVSIQEFVLKKGSHLDIWFQSKNGGYTQALLRSRYEEGVLIGEPRELCIGEFGDEMTRAEWNRVVGPRSKRSLKKELVDAKEMLNEIISKGLFTDKEYKTYQNEKKGQSLGFRKV